MTENAPVVEQMPPSAPKPVAGMLEKLLTEKVDNVGSQVTGLSRQITELSTQVNGLEQEFRWYRSPLNAVWVAFIFCLGVVIGCFVVWANNRSGFNRVDWTVCAILLLASVSILGIVCHLVLKLAEIRNC